VWTRAESVQGHARVGVGAGVKFVSRESDKAAGAPTDARQLHAAIDRCRGVRCAGTGGACTAQGCCVCVSVCVCACVCVSEQQLTC